MAVRMYWDGYTPEPDPFTFVRGVTVAKPKSSSAGGPKKDTVLVGVVKLPGQCIGSLNQLTSSQSRGKIFQGIQGQGPRFAARVTGNKTADHALIV